MTILIVDDQDIKVNKIKTVINESTVGRDATIYISQNVADAVDFLSKNIAVDLMILDLNMPIRGGDEIKKDAGLGVIKEIKRQKDLIRPQHVIGLTGVTPVDESSTRFFSADGWYLAHYDPKSAEWEDVISNKLYWIQPAPTQALIKPRRKLLYICASPKDQDPLGLGTEQRKLQDTLQMSQNRDDFEFHASQGTTFSRLSLQMFQVQPEFLHLSGHGDERGLVLEDEHGMTSYTAVEAINQLIIQNNTIRCIFINACYSSAQAKFLSQNQIYVIGLDDKINNRVAEEFAVGFYQSVYMGMPIKHAYLSAIAHGIAASNDANFNSTLWFDGIDVH